MPVDRKRLLEIAATKLEEERDRIDSELAEIRKELKRGSGKKPVQRTKSKGRKLSVAQRKAQSKRMKKYWSERKKKKQGK